MWLLAVSCFCFTSLFNTNLIESSKEQIQNQQLECDPDTAENCDNIQITSNESSSIVRQSKGSDQISIHDSLEAENREVQIDNPGTQEGKKFHQNWTTIVLHTSYT